MKIRSTAVLGLLLGLAAKSAESQQQQQQHQRGPTKGLHFQRPDAKRKDGGGDAQGGRYSRRRLDEYAVTDGEETESPGDETRTHEEEEGLNENLAAEQMIEGQNMDMGIGAFAMHTNTKSPKASKGGGGTKSPKASKGGGGTKSPKASSGTKSPKASKGGSGTKSPKASSGTKSPKASSGTKSPKASKGGGTKSPKASKGR